MQFCPKSILSDKLPPLRLLELGNFPPSWTRTSLHFFSHCCASSRRGLPFGSSSVGLMCCSVLTPKACMRSPESCSCHEAHLPSQGWPLSSSCLGWGRTFAFVWWARPLRLRSLPRSRMSSCMALPAWWSGGAYVHPEYFYQLVQYDFVCGLGLPVGLWVLDWGRDGFDAEVVIKWL